MQTSQIRIGRFVGSRVYYSPDQDRDEEGKFAPEGGIDDSEGLVVSVGRVGADNQFSEIKYRLSKNASKLAQSGEFINLVTFKPEAHDLLTALDGKRLAGMTEPRFYEKGTADKLNKLAKTSGMEGLVHQLGTGTDQVLIALSRAGHDHKNVGGFYAAVRKRAKGGNYALSDREEYVLGEFLGFSKKETAAYLRRKKQFSNKDVAKKSTLELGRFVGKKDYYSPDQDRDEEGKFAPEGEGGGSGKGRDTSKGKGGGLLSVKDSANTFIGDDPYSNAITINHKIRSGMGMEKDEQKIVDDLDKAFKSETPLKEQITVFRGFADDIPKDWESGIMLRDSAFVSTSRSKEVAEEFASSTSLTGRGTVFKITIPKGARILDIGAAASRLKSNMAEAQEEVILPRNSWFKVMSRSGDKISMQYVGNGSRWSLGK